MYHKFILQCSTPPSSTGTKLISPSKIYNELLLEQSMNSLKVGVFFATYQIMRARGESWAGPCLKQLRLAFFNSGMYP